MEARAKISILDGRISQRLFSATALAGFNLEKPHVAKLRERYLDIAGGAFRARGYSCRIRGQDWEQCRVPSTFEIHRTVQITPLWEMRQ